MTRQKHYDLRRLKNNKAEPPINIRELDGSGITVRPAESTSKVNTAGLLSKPVGSDARI